MRIIDLFSGAGGLTFGFNYNLINGEFVERNNVEFIFANEYAAHAVNAFRQNFPRINMIQGDIKNLTNEKIHELTGNDDVDIIIGGPPCQSFSTVGKRNYDDRAKLSIEYLRVLEAVRPKMFLFENVRGILSMREIFYLTDANGNVVHRDVEKHRGATKFTVKEPVIDHYGELIIDKIRTEFERLGYTPYVNVVKAADFGVPQNRERVVIVGMRNDLGLEWQYPQGENPQLTISDAKIYDKGNPMKLRDFSWEGFWWFKDNEADFFNYEELFGCDGPIPAKNELARLHGYTSSEDEYDDD